MERKEEKSVGIRELLAVVLKRKWLIIIPLILATASGYGTTFLLTPKYRSSTIIWIDRPHNVSRESISIIGREANPRLSSEDRRLAPFWPDRKQILVMAFQPGLVIGGGAVFLAEVLDNSFREVDAVEELLGLPMLAAISRIEKLPHIR
jgi:capsular polysaccharide biosynthesis protein